MRTFVFTDATSNKFWHIELSGKAFTVTFGRVGTTGQTQTKSFPDAAKAKTEHDKLVAEKLKKGYVETTPAAPAVGPVLSSGQKALEAALVEHADDIAAHSAYADYLLEQGDPRGEFAQVQLALEDESRPKAERDSLKKREAALLKKHAAEWLGDAARFLIGTWSGEDKPYHYRFARGWLDAVRVLPVPEAVVAAVANAPEARLLRQLEVVYDMRYHPFEFDQFTDGPTKAIKPGEPSGAVYDATSTLPLLINSPHLANLRVLKYGFSDDRENLTHSTMVDPFGGSTGRHVIELLEKCPRLEELYLNTALPHITELFASKALGNVRVLQYYFGTEDRFYNQRRQPQYPLGTLAKNKALKNLTTLRLHPGRDTTVALDEIEPLLQSKHLPALAHLQLHMTTEGDEIAERVVRSGIMKRLKTLDLGYGNMTDAGARVLAASADAKKLDALDLSRNALTPQGVKALRAAGVKVVAEDQHGDGDTEYLYEVDVE